MTEPADRDWAEFVTLSQSSALENTSTQDCAAACKALESLASAARHICEISADHCEEAKARLRTATDRVHAACPQCEVRAQQAQEAQGTTMTSDTLVVHTAQSSRGGCGGCATASGAPDFGTAIFVIATLSARIRWAARRRSKKSSSDSQRASP